jgi:hypothetical protein
LPTWFRRSSVLMRRSRPRFRLSVLVIKSKFNRF